MTREEKLDEAGAADLHRRDRTLDCRGLLCPLPALETRRALDELAPGGRLLVICTDPAAVIDLAALCDETGDRLLDQLRHGDELRFWIERQGGAG